MAYRKASEETKAVALGSADFWAAVQNGGDVQVSVGDIVTYLRTVLQISDVNQLQAALDAIAAKAAGDTAALSDELDAALGSLGGSVEDSIADLQADVNTRATKTELTTALGGLDGSVKTKLDALTADVAQRDADVNGRVNDLVASNDAAHAELQTNTNTRATKTEVATKDAAVRADFKTADDAVRSAFATADAAVRADMKTADDAITADVAAKDTAVRTAFAAGDTAVRGEFAAADTAIRTDMKKADDALAADATAKDTAVRAAFAAGDTAVRGEFKTADDKVRADIKLVTDTLATKTALDAAVADTDTRATKTALADARAALQADINTRATSTALVNAQAALQSDINTRQTKAEAEAVRASLQADIDSRATKAQLGSAAGANVGAGAWNVPQLQADGKLLASTLPALAITDTFPVASQAAMLGLVAERGDIAIRSDLNRCFVLQAEPASTLANWKELLTPTDAVLAVAGLTGSITASALKAALGIAIGDVAGLQGALDSLRNDMNGALATKLDKSGGTIGSLSVTNDLTSDRLTYTRATTLGASFDLNTLLTAGFYDGSGMTNAPDSGWWYVEVQRHTNGNGYITQRVTRLNGAAEVYHRNSQGGTWGAWFRMWSSLNFDPNSKASLDASVSFAALAVSGNQTVGGTTSYGATTRQMINLWSTGYGIGVQGSTAYVRTGSEFAVHQGGTHSDEQGNPGAGGTNLLRVAPGYFNYKGQGVWHSGNFDPASKHGTNATIFKDATGVEQHPWEAKLAADRTAYQYAVPAGVGVFDTKIGSIWSYDSNGDSFLIRGQKAWTAGNFDPGSKLNLTGGDPTGQLRLRGNTGSIASRAGDGSFLQVFAENAASGQPANAAAMTFHRGQQFATWFGLDTDNEFKHGGWSEGANAYRFWTAKNFNPSTKADLNGSVSFNTLTVANRPNWGGLTPWDNGNFNPDTKANANDASFTGIASFPTAGGGAFQIKAGTGDGGSLATHNVRLRTWWGLGIESYDGIVRGVYDSRAGVWNTLGVPQVNGSPVWYPGNFNPATKADLNGNVVFNRLTVSENGTGTALQIGDDAQMGDINVPNTIGVRGLSSAAQAFFQMGTGGSRVGYDGGNWIMSGGGNLYIQPGAGGSYGVWHAGNFNPATKADVGASAQPRFGNGVIVGNRSAYVYTDGGTDNLRVRTGAGTEAAPFKYFGFNDDGTFQTFNGGMIAAGNITSTGDVTATGRMIVGVGQNYSYIEMRDADEGTRYIHNNSGSIGFLGKDGQWKLRSFEDGSLWTSQLGDLNTRIETRAGEIAGALANSARNDANANANNRVAKGGDTMTGDLTIQKFDPALYFRRSDNGNVERIVLDVNSTLQFQDGNGVPNLSIAQGGAVYTRQLGDLKDWIEGRGRAWGEWGRDRAWESASANFATKTNPTISTGLRIEGGNGYGGNWPLVSFYHSGVEHWQITAPNNGELYFRNGDTADVRVSFRRDGSIWSPFYGALHDYVNGRAEAYAAGAHNNANGRVAKTGDRMTGMLEIAYDYPSLRLHYGGVRWTDIQVRNDGRVHFWSNGETASSFSVGAGGDIWTRQMGDVAQRIEDRAAAIGYTKASEYYEARSPVRANIGSRQDMAGPLSVTNEIDFVRGGVLRARWKVEPEGYMNLQNGDNGDQYLQVYTDGRLWTKQLGDLNSRIENRANEWGAAHASGRIARTGDTMSGDLYIDKSYPGLQLTNRDGSGFGYVDFCHTPYGHGDHTWRMKHDPSNNEWQVGYIDNGARLAVRTDGSVWTAQLGDLNTRIENRINNKSFRLAFAGDQNANANLGNMWEPYGGAVITGFTGANTTNGFYAASALRFRYAQMSDSGGNWYTCGYA